MRYIGLVLLAGFMCSGFSCATVKGKLDIARDDTGKIVSVKHEAKGTADWKVKEGETSIEVKTKNIPKPSILDKVTDLATVGMANRVTNRESDKD